jgi:hypothetical protein
MRESATIAFVDFPIACSASERILKNFICKPVAKFDAVHGRRRRAADRR